MQYPGRSALAALLLSAAMLVAPAGATAAGGRGKGIASATLRDPGGREAGLVTFTNEGGMLHGRVSVTGATPGEHGMHVHTVGKCEGPKFTSAGGHLNPDAKQHGLKNPQGPHQGDLPSLLVGPNGTGKARFMLHSTPEALFDADGSAFIIHAAPDDDMTDPSGNSGERVLCGVIEHSARR